MIQLIHDYWRAYLFTDGEHITGVAITLWLLVVSIGIGFCLSVPLAVFRVSTNRWVAGPVWLFTYVFRGTPLYIQLLLFYTGLYSLQVIRDHAPLDAFFRSGMNCTLLAFTLNTCAYTTEVFAGAIKATPYGEVEAARAYGMSRFTCLRRIVDFRNRIIHGYDSIDDKVVWGVIQSHLPNLLSELKAVEN